MIGLGPALIAGISAVVLALLTWVLSRMTRRADAAGKIADAASVLIEPLTKRVESLEADLHTTNARLRSVEQDRDVLASAARTYREWEIAGRPIPPGPPTLDDLVHGILDRLYPAGGDRG